MKVRRWIPSATAIALVATSMALTTSTSVGASSTLAEDTFSRSQSSGWGQTETGASWSEVGPSSAYSVASGIGQIVVPKGVKNIAELGGVDAASVDVRVDMSTNASATGGGNYFWVTGRGDARNGYSATTRVTSSGAVNLSVRRTVNGATTVLAANETAVPAPTVGTPLRLRLVVEGHAPTTVQAKLWPVGSSEPASWQVEATDASTALPSTGSVALGGYLSGSATSGSMTFRFDNLAVTSPVQSVSPPSTGSTKPTAETTGVPDGTSLKLFDPTRIPNPKDVVFSDGPVLVINTPNAVYDGYQFNAFVEIRAAGVKIKNSLFRGGVTTAQRPLLRIRNENFGLGVPSVVVEDSTFIPRNLTNLVNGVQGSQFTLRRVEISKTVDGVHIHGTSSRSDANAGNVTIADSWIHDLIHYNDNSHSDGTHNDGVQISGGHDITITGSRIDGTIYSAGVMIAKDRNDIYNVAIRGNWLASGWATINEADKSFTPVNGLVIQDNVFTRGSTTMPDFAMILSKGTRAITTASGNTWHDNSTPAPYMRQGQ